MLEGWERISELARLAPTPHNTQPFRLRPISEREAELVLLPSRLLPEEDRENRYLYAAIGIFGEALVLAARANGQTATITPAPFPGVLTLDAPETVVARVTLDPAEKTSDDAKDEAARALLKSRRTSRLPYHPRPVDEKVQARLIALTESFGHRLKIQSDPTRVADLLRQNAWAIIDNLQLANDRREIEKWVRYGPTPTHGDGLWQVPLAQPAWELKLGFRFPWIFRIPGISHYGVHRFAASMKGTQHVALLSGPFRAWPDLIASGKLLMQLWAEMAANDLYMHPFGSTLTNAKHAKIIGDKFGDGEGWLIFRFGYSDVPPAAPRLPSVVMAKKEMR
jgi:hypothetical protein